MSMTNEAHQRQPLCYHHKARNNALGVILIELPPRLDKKMQSQLSVLSRWGRNWS